MTFLGWHSEHGLALSMFGSNVLGLYREGATGGAWGQEIPLTKSLSPTSAIEFLKTAMCRHFRDLLVMFCRILSSFVEFGANQKGVVSKLCLLHLLSAL